MKKRLLDLRNILLIVGISLQVAWIAALFAALYVSYNRGQTVGLDFLTYFSAGSIVRSESATRLYDLDLQRSIQESVVSLESLPRFYPFNHPPILAPLMGWAVNGDYNASYLRWVSILVLFQLASLGVLVKMLHALDWRNRELWILGISGLLFYPVFLAYLRGQDSPFLLLAVSLWAFGVLTGRDRIAGLGLALTIIRPQIALVLALPFLFKRRRVWWWFVAGGTILLLYCTLLVGTRGMLDLSSVLLLSGQGLGFDVDKMATLMGAVLRLFPSIDPQLLHGIGYGGYALSILFLCILWARSGTIEFRHIGLAVLLGTLFAPHLHGHDLCVLLIPALGAATGLARPGAAASRYAALLPMGISILLIASDLFAVKFPVYLGMVILALLLWLPAKAGRTDDQGGSRMGQ